MTISRSRFCSMASTNLDSEDVGFQRSDESHRKLQKRHGASIWLWRKRQERGATLNQRYQNEGSGALPVLAGAVAAGSVVVSGRVAVVGRALLLAARRGAVPTTVSDLCAYARGAFALYPFNNLANCTQQWQVDRTPALRFEENCR